MSGWFSVKRGFLDHELFRPDGKWSRAEAWLWMIENAAFSETVIDIGGKPFTVKRGELCFSLRFLAGKWGWGVKAVRVFLERLQSHKAVTISLTSECPEKGTGRTLITLCNYDKYQSKGHDKGTGRAQEGHKEEQGNNSVSKDTGGADFVDPVKAIFDAGVKVLAAAGKTEGQARAIVGKWRKEHSPEAVLVAIGRAQREGAIDPVSFIEGALRFSSNQRREKAAPQYGDTMIRKSDGATLRYQDAVTGWIVSHG